MTMKYYYDTEFLEDGRTINLISIGIVAEDGREYYAVNSEADWDRIRKNNWLMEHVVSSLPTHSTGQVERSKSFGSIGKWTWGGLDLKDIHVKPKWVIRNEVREFMAIGDEGDPKAELWADYAAYDHVALAQLFGRMIDLPEWIPMYTHDFQQRLDELGRPELPAQTEGAHNALEDARHLKRCFDHVLALHRAEELQNGINKMIARADAAMEGPIQ